MKKILNNKWWLLVIILLVILSAGLVYLFLAENNKKTVQLIKKHYSTKVKVTSPTNLYSKDKKIEGTISDHLILELTSMEIAKITDKYFNIKDTNYYVYYKDVTPCTEELASIKEYYIPLSITVEGSNITLYKEAKEAVKFINHKSFDVLYQDKNYYYIKLFDQILGIKKDKNLLIKELSNTINESLVIPVIYLDSLTIDKVNERLEYLKRNNYYTITDQEYLAWKDNNIKVMEKAVLLLSSIPDEEKGIYKKSFALNADNKVSQKGSTDISSYLLKNDTSISDYKKMLEGKQVVTVLPPPVVPVKEQKIPVLNYHFFFNPDGGEVCSESICLPVKKFEEHLKYLSVNGYKTLTTEEFRAWMYKEIELPKKSVLITIDDGAMGTGKHNGNKLIPLLEKYNLHATLFLITGWWDIENYRSPNLDIQSHTNDMHQGNACKGKSLGAQMLCYPKDRVLNDLKKSIAITKSSTSFCYPFYVYDSSAINNVKEAGFKIAFAGGNRKASRKSPKYAIPRYPIANTITMEDFIAKIN
ncbi:MAG: polysaccharide deacetylase family protein [Bacilli bacterium]